MTQRTFNKAFAELSHHGDVLAEELSECAAER